MRALAALFAAAALTQAAAQTYPSKPVRVLAPFPAGSGVDIVARAVAIPLAEAWGQAVVVDNRPGAGGTLASELAAKAPPDGYTLLLGNVSTLAIAPALYRGIGYDPVRSFAPVTQITTAANALVVHPSVPVTTTQEFIALARAKPGQLNYGSAGSGTTPHLAAELFRQMTGVVLVHVPYKGSPQAVTDLLGGQTQLMFATIVTTLPHIRQGRLRALGVTSLKRAALLPDVPTLNETGLKGYEVTGWQGITAPAGTPQTIVAGLHQALAKILATRETRERLDAQGLEVVASSPAAFGAYIAAEFSKWKSVIRKAGVTAD